MITNTAAYASFKAQSLARQILNLDEKYRILESLYQEACLLGCFRKHDLHLGLEDDIRLAAALNANVSNAPR